MGGEALRNGEWSRMDYAPGEVGCQCFKGAGRAGGREGAGVVTGEQVEGLLQGGLDSGDDAAVRMIGLQGPTATEQMGETALMGGGGELPIRRPAVADDHPRRSPRRASSRPADSPVRVGWRRRWSAAWPRPTAN